MQLSFYSRISHPDSMSTTSLSPRPHNRRVMQTGSFEVSTPKRSPSHNNISIGDDHNGSLVRKDSDKLKKSESQTFFKMNSIKFLVLMVLCLQNTFFTVMRRYSLGVLREKYSKYEVLLAAEVIKVVFSAFQIAGAVPQGEQALPKLKYILRRSSKMGILALIYGAMNILSFVSLRNISAGIFTIFAQLKILTTAVSSSIILRRSYSWTKWRALISLMLGVLLFSEPIWNNADMSKNPEGGNVFLGTVAVLIEVSLSGFASIYFEKVIKTDPEQMGIWERNYQLAFTSIPIYIGFILWDKGGEEGFGRGWSVTAGLLSLLGAAGGLLVALSIKHGDSILKTLATTGAIVFSALLDHFVLGGPLTSVMCIAGVQVILSICNYTFDVSPPENTPLPFDKRARDDLEEAQPLTDMKDEENDLPTK
ncbi:hypothetical protein ACHAWX_001706 [Stephanocyclus meneghinianus]